MVGVWIALKEVLIVALASTTATTCIVPQARTCVAGVSPRHPTTAIWSFQIRWAAQAPHRDRAPPPVMESNRISSMCYSTSKLAYMVDETTMMAMVGLRLLTMSKLVKKSCLQPRGHDHHSQTPSKTAPLRTITPHRAPPLTLAMHSTPTLGSSRAVKQPKTIAIKTMLQRPQTTSMASTTCNCSMSSICLRAHLLTWSRWISVRESLRRSLSPE